MWRLERLRDEGVASEVGAVAGKLFRVDLHADFDPRRNYELTVRDVELTPVERNARAATPDDIDLDL